MGQGPRGVPGFGFANSASRQSLGTQVGAGARTLLEPGLLAADTCPRAGLQGGPQGWQHSGPESGLEGLDSGSRAMVLHRLLGDAHGPCSRGGCRPASWASALKWTPQVAS